jgi:hypothetical protein
MGKIKKMTEKWDRKKEKERQSLGKEEAKTQIKHEPLRKSVVSTFLLIIRT